MNQLEELHTSPFRPHGGFAVLFAVLAGMALLHVISAGVFADQFRELGVNPALYGVIVGAFGLASCLVARAFQRGARWLRTALAFWATVVVIAGSLLLLHGHRIGLPLPSLIAGFAVLAAMGWLPRILSNRARI